MCDGLKFTTRLGTVYYFTITASACAIHRRWPDYVINNQDLNSFLFYADLYANRGIQHDLV